MPRLLVDATVLSTLISQGIPFQGLIQTIAISNCVTLAMQEEKFQRLEQDYNDLYLKEDNHESITQFRDELLKRGMLNDIVDEYIARYKHKNATKWIRQFGPQSLQEEIKSITPSTENIYLKRIRDRPYFNKESAVKIQITLPNHTLGQFTIRWYSIKPYFSPDTEEEDIPTPQGYIVENHELPSDTISTISTSNAAYLVLPLGSLLYDSHNTPSCFAVVWILELEEYGLLMNYACPSKWEKQQYLSTGSIPEGPIPLAQRIETLPGMEVGFSLAILSGLNLDKNRTADLKPIESKGFAVYPAGRFNGSIKPLRADLSVDIRK